MYEMKIKNKTVNNIIMVVVKQLLSEPEPMMMMMISHQYDQDQDEYFSFSAWSFDVLQCYKLLIDIKARRVGPDGSMSASGSAGPRFNSRRGSKFSFENFQPRG